MALQVTAPEWTALAVGGMAVVTDLRTRRVPNVLTFGAALAAFAFAAWTAGWSGLAASLAGWGVGCAVFLPFFLLGGLGAGDVKLLAAIGAWLGPTGAFWTAIYGGLAGGVLALAVAVSKGYLGTSFSNLFGLLMFWRTAGIRPMPTLTLESAVGPRLPYALPILAGAVVTIWLV